MISVSANNGQAPPSALSVIPGSNGDGSPHTAPHVTAQSYARLRAAMQAAGQGDLVPSDGWSCYRDLGDQQYMRDIGLTTIPVGQSIHGEWTYGSAVDFSGLGGFGAPRHNWLTANGPSYGWRQPSWATASGSLPEPWHWEYDQRDDSTPEPTPLPPEDIDMTIHFWNGNRGDALLAGGRLVALSSADTVNSLNASTIPRVVISDGDWDALAAWSTAPMMIVEPARGYALLTGGHAIPIGDMGTVYSLRASGVTETTVNQADWDRFVGGISSTQSTQSYGVHALLALVLAVALVVGLAVVLVTQVTADGVYAGAGTLLGGIVALLAYSLGRTRKAAPAAPGGTGWRRGRPV